jgi:hypothetical protein
MMTGRSALQTVGGVFALGALPRGTATAAAPPSPFMTTLSTYMSEASNRSLPDDVIEKAKHRYVRRHDFRFRIAARVRVSFGVNAAGALLILLAISSSSNQIRGVEFLFLAGQGSLLLTAIAGLTGHVGATGWWIVRTANLLMLAFSVYGAFFFHEF